MTAILGVSAFYHDSAAAIVIDGRIAAAAQEERFTRRKHDDDFPVHAIEYCLREVGLEPEDLDYVGFYDKPYQKFDRLLETYLAFAPAGFRSFTRSMPLWVKKKLHLPREMRKGLSNGYKKRYVFCEHHESHAASAFFPSPFEEAAILTLDGVGEWATATYGIGRGNHIELTHEQHFPHSLGLLYSAFTYYCGFKVNSGEFKLMGLAPYGEPRYADLILDKMIDLKEDGSFRLGMSYFNYCQGLTMISKAFEELFGGPPREADTPITEHYMDVAASIQRVTEEIMLRSARHVHRETGLPDLCLAGGVALNCVGNGRILREGPFERIWIQPAAGDAGGALGVALLIWYQLLGNERHASALDAQQGSLLGAAHDDDTIEAFLRRVDARYKRFESEDALCAEIAGDIAEGKVVGWFQGRMEFGPRALGSRSILGDARNPRMQSVMNLKVKFREGFRPFAPIVLKEHAHEYFDMVPARESPYMLLVTPVREDKRLKIPPVARGAKGIDRLAQQRSVIPAVTHVDYSARIQTVDEERYPLLYKLMKKFHEGTDCAVMVNTSFNLGWEPIVCTPREAYDTFMSSEIDVLCMGKCVLRKRTQPAAIRVARNGTSDEVLNAKLASPCCRAELGRHDGRLVCERCNHEFPITEDIPQLFWPHEETADKSDLTEVVKSFYEKNPFPNYNDHESIRSLIEKSRRGLYARRLDETIPYNSVLEVGCGTGQLTNFLAVSCRQVIGADICLNSLKLGEEFRKASGLERARFIQMNLFRPALKPGQFDVVLCNGVLMTTRDPFEGFQHLVELVKPGGHVVVGLYNTYGRLATDLRRQVFRITRGRATWIDPVLRQRGLSDDRRQAWYEDQYRHPRETKQTFGEVQTWFDRAGVEFVRGIPAMRAEDDGLDGASLFDPQPRGTTLDHFLVQAMQIVAPGRKEGGFFIMIGRKPGRAASRVGGVEKPARQRA